MGIFATVLSRYLYQRPGGALDELRVVIKILKVR